LAKIARFTDPDTLIIDPIIALHELLPPSTIHPTPLLLINSDQDAFNAGVMIIRVDPASVAILSQALAVEAQRVDYGGQSEMSDQFLLSRVITSHSEIRDRVWEIPMMWFNAYFLDNEEGGDWGKQDGVWTPKMQIHLVAGNKIGANVKKYTGLEQEVYDGVEDEARRKGLWMEGMDMGEAMQATEKSQLVRIAAAAWWSEARVGLPDMRFSEV
jgi:hypothetical protein